MSHDTQSTSRTVVESVAGFAAGLASTLVLREVAHPLDIIKTRLQSEHHVAPRIGSSVHILRRMFHEGRLQSFYRGLTPNVIGNTTSWALYFIWYDRAKDFLRHYHGQEVLQSHLDYFLASATAGVLTAICTNPVWVIKTRMLSTSAIHPGAYTSMLDGARQIVRTEGVRGFYRGLVPALFGVSQGALQFMAYESLKDRRSKQVGRELGSLDYLLLSGASKVFAGSITYPYQLIRTRLQMYDADYFYKGAMDVVRKVWGKEGLMGFYRGFGPNLLRVMPSTWVTFVVYEKTRSYLRSMESPEKKS